ncbi:hypothetical protein [Pedobacter sp. FW305-3-2-15-E-R2A2]|uniref:MutS-related protein n=1 Tax=Pedobacter sp. FW305-3-2-15-E-R2A2 TaxID=3140251 RepID=UPI003140C30C
MIIQGSDVFYEDRINKLKDKIKNEQKTDHLLSTAKLVSIIAIVALLCYYQSLPAMLLYAAIVAMLLLFIWASIVLNKVQLHIQFLKNKLELNKKELVISLKKYADLYNGSDLMSQHHPYATDLDLFGNGSIFQVLNRTSTLSGLNTLASWLSKPFLDKKEITGHQEAIRELSDQFEWCQDFCSKISTSTKKINDKASFFSWIATPNRLISTPLYKYLINILPLLSILLMVPTFIGIIHPLPFILTTLCQFVITLFHARHTNKIHKMIGPRLYYVDGILSIVELILSQNFESKKLKLLKHALEDTDSSAISEIKKLKRISDSFDSRMNPILAIVLNGIFLYDIRLVLSLEQWKVKNTNSFNYWQEIIGEFDALISLSIYSHNHPDYNFAEISSSPFYIKAKGIKHPLMDEQKVIPNDYEISGTPRIDILTGANMAGKSTFLRTLGVSMVLSMIGAPVNATRFIFSPTNLYTSLRTNDSLQNNESFFYAELKKLKGMMDTYAATPNVFFLLDEILKGTNSADQYNGARKLIEKLIRINGFGVIATHDLALSKLTEEYPLAVRNIRFEINIIDGKMSFRYKLEDGIAETMNGTFLLEDLKIV